MRDLGISVVTLWTEDRRLGALGAVATLSGGAAMAAAAVLVWGADPVSHYLGGRLAFPISYVNATGALFAVGFWPSILLAARRQGNVVVRAFALGAAAATLGGCLMTQSKGAVLGLIVASAFVFAVSPMRLRLFPPVALTLAMAAIAFSRLSEPYRVVGDEAIRRAGAASMTLAVVAVLVGLPYALLDGHVTISPRTTRRLGLVLLAAVVAGFAAAIGAFFVKIDHPGTWISDKWRQAHSYSEEEKSQPTHLLQVGSNRFDFWRVSLDEFQRRPILGDGARGFGPAYLIHGRSSETPRRAHSLPAEVLGEQGAVGFALLALGLGAPFLLALRRALRKDAVAIAAVGGALAWLVQAGVDWTWTFPANTLPAMVLLGVGASARDGVGPIPPLLAKSTAAVAVLVAIVAFAPPWLAARYTERGMVARSQPDLDRARVFDPLSTEPLLAEASIKPLSQAIPNLEKAVQKEPRVATTHYLLGLAYLEAGRTADARLELRAALRLQPGARLIEIALARAG